jgi:phosphatidylserine decarboxylase
VQQTQEPLYFDRYSGALRREDIYGEKPLRWAYETRAGRLCLELFIKRRLFSRLYGRWADSAGSAREIGPFIERFAVDVSEFREPVESFRTFNQFFYRQLRPEARPIAEGTNQIIFPADGRHLFISDLSAEQFLWAKGQRFDLATLLGDAALAERFASGSALISRLCPTDYHRFHFPWEGFAGTPRDIGGLLYSVNPLVLARNLEVLWQNKRRLTQVRDPRLGDCLFLEIGATNVGSIVATSPPETAVTKGQEKGYFRFGGSMVMTLFLPGRIIPMPDLAGQSNSGIELYARMGDVAANLAGE